MRVRAAEPERRDARGGPPRVPGPRLGRGEYAQAEFVEVGVRSGVGEVQLGRDLAVVQGQYGLDQPGDSGGRLQVAEVGLDRADQQRLRWIAPGAENAPEGVRLDRIAESR